MSTRLGKVHQKILDRLVKGDWVDTEELLRLTNQKYLDRRIRELRDEEGWQIIYERKGREHGYRLISSERGKGRKRHYLSSKEKRAIFERDDYLCQICGRGLSSEDAQIDHKVPLIRDGSLDASNLQTLCLECNVVKRSYCHKCKRPSCEDCFLAEPDLARNWVFLQLSSELYKKLEVKATASGKTLQVFVIDLLSQMAK